MFKKNIKKAFTLVEMLIVIIIIGILMAALLPKLKGAQERARDTARKANLSTLSTALQMYFNDEWTYPTGACVSDISSKLVPTYISSIPTDPQKKRKTFGTETNGCTNWNYAYSSLYRKWWKDAGAVLIANTEAEWTVGNFVLPQADGSNPAITFTGSTNDTQVDGQSINSTTDIEKLSTTQLQEAARENTAGSTHFSSATHAEKFVCSKVELAWQAASWTICDQSVSVKDGKAISNNSMVYVLFN